MWFSGVCVSAYENSSTEIHLLVWLSSVSPPGSSTTWSGWWMRGQMVDHKHYAPSSIYALQWNNVQTQNIIMAFSVWDCFITLFHIVNLWFELKIIWEYVQWKAQKGRGIYSIIYLIFNLKYLLYYLTIRVAYGTITILLKHLILIFMPLQAT